MSDGGRENTREHGKHRLRSGRKSGRDEYSKAIAKVAVAQVCENGGFQTCQLSALDTLSDVTIRYIRDIGKTALLYANLAGRTEVNHFDIIQGLEDLSAAQGFARASENDHCLAHSGVAREILQYVSDYEEVPFSYNLRRFPVDRERNRPRSFLQIGEEPPEEHIPGWLPIFPDPKTYNLSLKESTEVRRSPGHDVNVQFAKHQDRSQSQLPLPNMLNLFSLNGLPGPSSADTGNPAQTNEAVPLNPYLSAPVKVVEKEAIPAAAFPEKTPEAAGVEGNTPLLNNLNADSNIFASKTFAPANVAASSKSTNSIEQQLLSNQRTPVQFKIKIGKKSVVSGRMLSKGFTDKSSQRGSSSSSSTGGECDADDDMKERALKILKVSMGSPRDVAQVHPTRLLSSYQKS